MVVIERWSFYRGGLYSKFDCTSNVNISPLKTTECSKHLQHITIENNRVFQTLATFCYWKQQSVPNTCDIPPLKTSECSKHLQHIAIENNRVFQTLATCHQLKWQSVPNTCNISPLKTTECSKPLQHIAIEKNNFSEFNRYIFQISLRYIKLVIAKMLIILVLCNFTFYFKDYPRLPQNTSNVNIESTGKSEQLYYLCDQLLGALIYLHFIVLILICF